MVKPQGILKLTATTMFAGCLSLAAFPAVTAEASFPIGKYTLTGQQVTLTFNGSAEFRVTEGAVTQVIGRYAVKAGKLTFTDRKGPWACTQTDQATGTYQWTYADPVLTFSKVADNCAERVQSLTAGTWTRQP